MTDQIDIAPRTRKVSDSAVGEITEKQITIATSSGEITVDISDAEKCDLWIFGYGSLVWKPNFEYNQQLVGSIQGFKRRFWQGNSYHRGNSSRPGRVATLVPKPTTDLNNNPELRTKIQDPPGEEEDALDYTTWGVAFQLLGREQILAAINHLNMRETQLGGYDIVMTEFTPQMKDSGENPNPVPSIPSMVFMATTQNPIYLGPSSSMEISKEICQASGACGTNVEYLLKLCQWQKSYVPNVKDTHLTNLETHCLHIMKDVIQEQQNTRCSSPARVSSTTNWLDEQWVMSYIYMRRRGSEGLKCSCHQDHSQNPKDFFGPLGMHYS